jgi:glycosyltransferase involved in cell wall biosynthesis
MEINLHCPINLLGYGIVSVNILKALKTAGHKVFLHPIGNGAEINSEADKTVLEESLRDAETYNPQSPCLKIWHAPQLKQMIGRGLHIGMPIFELDRFSPNEIHQLNSIDRVIVASRWAAQVLEANGVKTRIGVAPYGVDRSIFRPATPGELNNSIANDTATKFLSIGKWEVRKGHDIIVEAFNKAFTQSDNVSLIMNCHNPFIGSRNAEWEELYQSSPLGEKIFVFNERLQNQYNVATLMQSVDCGLFPARAEGWNLEALEMLSCGKPIIITDGTAHREYTNHHNSMLIEVDKKEEAYDGVFFFGQGQWFALEETQSEQLIHYMREVHRIKQESGSITNEDGIKTAEHFSWTRTANRLELLLE